MKEGSVLRTLRFIFITVVLFVLTFSAATVTILNIYVPKYLATVKGKEVGYFTSPGEFDEVYEKLVAEKKADGIKVKVYLKDEPEFSLSYVRNSVVDRQNVYTNLREILQAEYTIYNVLVKGKSEMTFADKKDAEVYANKLKGSIKSTVKVDVATRTTNKLAKITDTATAKKTLSTLVSRYRPYYRTVSASTYAYTGAATYMYGKPSAALYSFMSGGRRPTTGIITQGFGGSSYGTYRHQGVDIASNACPGVYAYKAGTVIKVATGGSSYGCYVMISHGTDGKGNELITMYAHLGYGSITVNVGDKVTGATRLGTMGATGNSTGIHLHFEMRIVGNGTTKYYNPAFFI